MKIDPIIRVDGFSSFAVAVALSAAGSASAQAQGLAQAPASAMPSQATVLAFPSTFGIPTAVAPRSGTAFVGVNYANPRGGAKGAGGDGDIIAGYSVGNPFDALTLTFGVAITGIDPLGDAGALSLSFSRVLRVGRMSATFIGASASNLAAWGVNDDRAEAYSAYVSHILGTPLGSYEVPIQITIGYGTDVTLAEDGSGSIRDGLFAGLGIGLTQNFSAGVSATRTQLNVGFTYSLPGTGVSATFGVMDVTDNTNRRQSSWSVGFSF